MTTRERQLLGCLTACVATPIADGSAVEPLLRALGSLLGAPFIAFAVQESSSRRILFSARVELEPGAAATIESRARHTPVPKDSGILKTLFRVVPLPDGGTRALLGGVPDDADPALTAAVMTELVPRLATAVLEQRRRRDPEESLATLAIEHLPLGIVVARQDGRVAWRNAAAARLLARSGDLAETDGFLHAQDPAVHRRLRQLLEAATGLGSDGQPAALAVPRSGNGLRPLSVVVAPLLPGVRLGESGPRDHALVLLGDSETRTDGLRDALARCYGLTPSEARVAAQALLGKSLDELAAALYISHNTAKTHLKNIFAKVGVCRQSEMVAAILSGPVGLLMR